ncbi:MAG: DoxX family protein [Catenulispora sp.]|nr:DoxX family protein [Catenulispora sp.]
MNVALWIAAGLLAVIALGGGALKVAVPKAKLAAQKGGEWMAGISGGLIKGIGWLEVLAAFGLILPRAVGVAPVLVPVTAVCWMALMVGASATHLRLGQRKLAMVPVLYLGIAAFVAVGRF